VAILTIDTSTRMALVAHHYEDWARDFDFGLILEPF
jgi:hypothetical protein